MSSSEKSGYSDASSDVTSKMQGQLTFLIGSYEQLSNDADVKDKLSRWKLGLIRWMRNFRRWMRS